MNQSSSPADVPWTAPEPLAVGSRLDGFEIERVIARNAVGVVYAVRDTLTGEPAALKEYLPAALVQRGADGISLELRTPAHADAFARGLQAFLAEARLFEGVDHPSLLKVRRFFEAHGGAYRVMPLYPGHRLLDIRRGMDEPPDEPALRSLLDGVLGALEALHAKRAIHGDIHPGSILLMPDDTPVLLDAGAVQRAIEGEEARSLVKLMGPGFAAPEQRAAAPGATTGPWTDLYALAAVVRYCIGGRLPEPGSTQMADGMQSLAEVLREQSARFPHLRFSRHFIDAIEAALVPQPQERPQDVAQMRALLEGQPAVPPSASARADELLDENDEPITLAPPPLGLPAAEPPVARPRQDDPAQVRVLAALEVALGSIDAPPADTADGAPPPLYATPDRGDQRPRGPLERRGGRHAALWGIGIVAGLLVAGAAALLILKRNAPELRLVAPEAATAASAAELSQASASAPATPLAAAPAAEAASAEPPAAPAPTLVQLAVPEPDEAASAAAPAAGPAAAVAAVVASVDAPKADTPASDVAAPPRPALPAASASKPVQAAKVREGATKRVASAAKAAKPAALKAAGGSPRDVCGERTPFALYRCMQTQCALPQWTAHAQCQHLREHDEVQ